MAINKATPITEADVDAARELLSEMKHRANQAHDDGNLIMLSVYADMIRLISPKVSQLRERLEREDRAGINRQHRDLRLARRMSGNNGSTQQSA
ncbi:MAG TPA: hypothetical protein VNG51_01350 [Ktedonobacteraceae bacterium]|nr:hypothetical protein [Ktedonobacteraceae bacterium]